MKLNPVAAEANSKPEVFVPPSPPQYPVGYCVENGITFNGSHALAIEI